MRFSEHTTCLRISGTYVRTMSGSTVQKLGTTVTPAW